MALPVFMPAAALIGVLVVFALVAPDTASALFASIRQNVIGAFGWYYVEFFLVGSPSSAARLSIARNSGRVALGADGSVRTDDALFGLLTELPVGCALLVRAILLIAIFFITSTD